MSSNVGTGDTHVGLQGIIIDAEDVAQETCCCSHLVYGGTFILVGRGGISCLVIDLEFRDGISLSEVFTIHVVFHPERSIQSFRVKRALVADTGNGPPLFPYLFSSSPSSSCLFKKA